MSRDERSLGMILVQEGMLAQGDLDDALAAQAETGKRLGEVLVEQGLLGEQALRWALAEQMDLPLVNPVVSALDPEAIRLIPAAVCRRYGVLPMLLSAEGPGEERVLTLAAADPAAREVLEDVAGGVAYPVRVVAALREEIEAILDRVHGPAPAMDVEIRGGELPEDSRDEILEDPTGNVLLRHLLSKVLELGKGGLHLRVRGGSLEVEDLEGRTLFSGGGTWHTILLDRLCQLAGLPRRHGGVLQHGRFTFPSGESKEPAVFRVSVLKGVEDEEAQVKLLLTEGRGRTLAELGLTAHQVLEVRSALAEPGLFWVTAAGEEGLGSTLFGLLREIPDRGRTVTVEEEVVYRSPDFLQFETLNLNSATRRELLRELKYLDFDRVMVDRVSPAQLGDLLALAVRKRWVLAATAEASLEETLATIARRAAELPLYGLRLVVHQRLVPLLCPGCRVACALGTAEKQALGKFLPAAKTLFQEGEGCSRCGRHAVVGARAFFEVLPVDAPVREALYGESRGEPRLEVLTQRVRPSIRTQVAEAVARGEVSLAELWDVV